MKLPSGFSMINLSGEAEDSYVKITLTSLSFNRAAARILGDPDRIVVGFKNTDDDKELIIGVGEDEKVGIDFTYDGGNKRNQPICVKDKRLLKVVKEMGILVKDGKEISLKVTGRFDSDMDGIIYNLLEGEVKEIKPRKHKAADTDTAEQ